MYFKQACYYYYYYRIVVFLLTYLDEVTNRITLTSTV